MRQDPANIDLLEVTKARTLGRAANYVTKSEPQPAPEKSNVLLLSTNWKRLPDVINTISGGYGIRHPATSAAEDELGAGFRLERFDCDQLTGHLNLRFFSLMGESESWKEHFPAILAGHIPTDVDILSHQAAKYADTTSPLLPRGMEAVLVHLSLVDLQSEDQIKELTDLVQTLHSADIPVQFILDDIDLLAASIEGGKKLSLRDLFYHTELDKKVIQLSNEAGINLVHISPIATCPRHRRLTDEDEEMILVMTYQLVKELQDLCAYSYYTYIRNNPPSPTPPPLRSSPPSAPPPAWDSPLPSQ